MWSDAGRQPRSSSSAGDRARKPKIEADRGLADQLGAAAQAEVVLPAHLEEVVEEADGAEPDEQEQQQERRGGRWRRGDHLGGEVAHDRGEHDHGATHGRGAALDVVGGRAVVADRLAEALPGEEPDRVARAEQRDQKGESSSEQDGSHVVLLPSPSEARRSSAISSSAAPRDAFTRTTSAAETLCRSQSAAASRPAVGRLTRPSSRACGAASKPCGDQGGVGTDGDEHVDAGLGGVRPHAAVRVARALAELEHLAEHRDRAPAAARADAARASPGRPAWTPGWRCRRR